VAVGAAGLRHPASDGLSDGRRRNAGRISQRSFSIASTIVEPLEVLRMARAMPDPLDMLEELARSNAVTISAIEAEITTQQAADLP
jgi:hypothetical protein